MMSCIILRVRRPVLCVIQMTRCVGARGTRRRDMFDVSVPVSVKSNLSTLDLFCFPMERESELTLCPVQCLTVSVDVIVVILDVALTQPALPSSAHTLAALLSPQCPGVRSSFPSLPIARPARPCIPRAYKLLTGCPENNQSLNKTPDHPGIKR